jgi:predicted XRE-type DNA-binding protein
MSRVKVVTGSDNIFADLGIPNPDEALAKADLVREISKSITRRGLTQSQAGQLLGIGQPRVSELVRGRVGIFSLETLIEFVKSLGNDVQLTVRPAQTIPAFSVVFEEPECTIYGTPVDYNMFAGVTPFESTFGWACARADPHPQIDFTHYDSLRTADQPAPPFPRPDSSVFTLVAA